MAYGGGPNDLFMELQASGEENQPNSQSLTSDLAHNLESWQGASSFLSEPQAGGEITEPNSHSLGIHSLNSGPGTRSSLREPQLAGSLLKPEALTSKSPSLATTPGQQNNSTEQSNYGARNLTQPASAMGLSTGEGFSSVDKSSSFSGIPQQHLVQAHSGLNYRAADNSWKRLPHSPENRVGAIKEEDAAMHHSPNIPVNIPQEIRPVVEVAVRPEKATFERNDIEVGHPQDPLKLVRAQAMFGAIKEEEEAMHNFPNIPVRPEKATFERNDIEVGHPQDSLKPVTAQTEIKDRQGNYNLNNPAAMEETPMAITKSSQQLAPTRPVAMEDTPIAITTSSSQQLVPTHPKAAVAKTPVTPAIITTSSSQQQDSTCPQALPITKNSNAPVSKSSPSPGGSGNLRNHSQNAFETGGTSAPFGTSSAYATHGPGAYRSGYKSANSRYSKVPPEKREDFLQNQRNSAHLWAECDAEQAAAGFEECFQLLAMRDGPIEPTPKLLDDFIAAAKAYLKLNEVEEASGYCELAEEVSMALSGLKLEEINIVKVQIQSLQS